mmetsp:Transcript_24916/g.59365  ORF Transcript_24916/g.59365 Transcript_24916/m.59365 type:complete len:242 (-) Transcript_24916:59-784(-)
MVSAEERSRFAAESSAPPCAAKTALSSVGAPKPLASEMMLFDSNPSARSRWRMAASLPFRPGHGSAAITRQTAMPTESESTIFHGTSWSPVSSKRMTESTKKAHAILTNSAAREGYRKSTEPSARSSHTARNGERRSARLPMPAPLTAASSTVTLVLYVVPDASARQRDAVTGASILAAKTLFHPLSNDPRNSREEIPHASPLRIGQDHRLQTRSNISICLQSTSAGPLTKRRRPWVEARA